MQGETGKEVISMELFLTTCSNKKSEKRKANESDILQQLEQQEKTGGGRASIGNDEGDKEDSEVRIELSYSYCLRFLTLSCKG
jgi:hypothetical protein